MSLSGSTNWTLTADSIVLGAFRLLGKRDSSALTNYKSEALEALNGMVRAWQAEGLFLWKIRDITVFLEDDAQYYDIGPSGDEAAIDPVKTEIATAASATDTSIEVDSDTGISDGDVIGIELDDGSIQWTTVNGAPSSDTVDLDAALTDDVSVDNHVYAYTSLPARPVKVFSARLVDSDDEEREIWLASREEYMQMPDKSETGECVMAYADMRTTNIRMYVWPACDDVKYRIILTAAIPPDDFDATTDDADFPPEWIRALRYNLAVEIAAEHGVEPSPSLMRLALESKMQIVSSDIESPSVIFSIAEE